MEQQRKRLAGIYTVRVISLFLVVFILTIFGAGARNGMSAIDESNAALNVIFFHGEQPQRFLSGKVTATNGQSLPGVTILIKGTTAGTTTDGDGNFRIEIPGRSVTLVFSFIGMETQETVIDNQAFVSIVMTETDSQLDEVVVTGYQTLSKERATGSFNVVKGDRLQKPTSDIAERLVGNVSGLQSRVDQNGNAVLEIRGQTSLNVTYGTNTDNVRPLVVVDGFPVDGEFASINPNDVESITILKDAAAASIWGARSANGVVVITTKRGAVEKTGKTNVEFSTFYKVSPKADLRYANPIASSVDVIDYEQKGFASDFFGGPWPPISNTLTSVTAGYSQALTAMNEHRLGYISEAEMNATIERLKGLDNHDQLKKYLFQNPSVNQYNLIISSSTERSRSVFSMLYENRKGNFKPESEERYMANYRTTVKFADWVDFSFSGMAQYNKITNSYTTIGTISSLSPYDMLVDEAGSRADLSSLNFYKPILERMVPTEDFPYSDWSYNPISDMENSTLGTREQNFRIQAGFTFRIMEGLTLDSKAQYESYISKKNNIYDESHSLVRRTINTGSSWNQTTGEIKANHPKGGFKDMSESENTAYNIRNQLNFNRIFNDIHDINFIAGTEVRDRVVQSTTFPRTFGYNDETLSVGIFPNGPGGSFHQLSNWMGSAQTFAYVKSFKYDTDRYFSLYGNASYTYNNKYTLSGSARTDASNMISDDPKYRYSPFWSAGIGWQIGKEEFMQPVEWLERLNLRLTYGYNGNVDRTTSFRPLINFNTTLNSYIHDYTAAIGSFGNPALRWEKTGTTNLGIDFSAFNNKLSGKVDVYDKQGKDLIVSMTIPSVNGTTTQRLNKAKMINRGIEIELGTNIPIQNRDISWQGSLNFSYNKNKITELFIVTYSAYNLYGGETAAYVQGHDANTLWVFKYAGVVNQGTEANPDIQPMVQGKDTDLYGFGAWTPGDGRDYMLDAGTKVAPFNLGFNSSFKVYDFDLSFMVTGKFGHVFKRQSFNYPAITSGRALPNDKYREVLNGDPMKVVPIPFGKVENRYYFWDRFYPYLDYLVESASHIRLTQLNISYNLPSRQLSRLNINSLKAYVQGDNLLTILNNNYKEDPEYSKGRFNLPSMFYAGLRITF